MLVKENNNETKNEKTLSKECNVKLIELCKKEIEAGNTKNAINILEVLNSINNFVYLLNLKED